MGSRTAYQVPLEELRYRVETPRLLERAQKRFDGFQSGRRRVYEWPNHQYRLT